MRELPRRLGLVLRASGTDDDGAGVHLPTSFYWELAMLCLVTLSIFPHQMKYSMLYFVPAGAYVLYFYFAMGEGQVERHTADRVVGGVAMALLVVLAVPGRDLIGSRTVDILDYYHVMGIAVLLFLPILWYCHPKRFLARPVPRRTTSW